MVNPVKGTWYGHVLRGKGPLDVAVVPMLSCPNCGGICGISHTPEAAKHWRVWLGARDMPICHDVDYLGKLSPDLMCKHGRCDFHRTVYLDRWNKHKALFCLAYTEGRGTEIKFAYSHAMDAKEARFHLGRGNYNIIAGGPAVGFHFDERKNRLTAD